MSNYIEHIRVGSGEAWTIRDPNALPKTGGTISGNPLIQTTDDTGFASFEGTQQGSILEAYRDSSDQRRLLIIYNMENTSDAAQAVQIAQTTDGATWQTYLLYGEHNKPSPEELGAAVAANCNIVTYTALDQLSLSGAVTTAAVFQAMPAQSMLLMINSSALTNYLSDVPADYCNVVLFKSSEEYGSGIATKVNDSAKDTYVYDWYNDGSYNGWSLLGMGMDLLWTNASPISSYGASEFPEIELDLSSYKAVYVTFHPNTENATAVATSVMVPIDDTATGNSYDTASGFTHVQFKPTGSEMYNRYLRASTTGVVISEGRVLESFSDSSYSIDNTVLIPGRIYGIR